MSAAMDTPNRHVAYPDLNEYAPAWGQRHEQMATPVTLYGEPLGFAIGDVLPTRRWAIDETGACMSEFEFVAKYRQWHSNVVAPDGTIVAITAANKYHDPNLDPVPRIQDFVGERVDAFGFRVPIVTNEASPSEPLDAVANAQGEIGGEATEKMPAGFNAIKPDPEAEERLRKEVAGLRDELAQMREARTPAKKPPRPMEAAPCGKEIKQGYVHMHKRHCKAPECNEGGEAA